MGMQESLKKGTEGEYIAWNFFIKSKDVRSVVDVRDDAFFRAADVDFLIETKTRQFIWLEVKTDSMADRTGNIAYELISNKDYQTIGCFEKTKAQWFFYYLPNKSMFFLIDVYKLRTEAHSGKYSQRLMGDHAIGYLIPLNELVNKKIAIAYGV